MSGMLGPRRLACAEAQRLWGQSSMTHCEGSSMQGACTGSQAEGRRPSSA